MTTVASILSSVAHDLKMSSSESTSRQSELIAYINRAISTIISPMVLRFKSDLGMKEWTMVESSAYVPQYTLPTDFLSFYSAHAREKEHSGTLASAASSTSVTLDSDASASDDAYNGMLIRLTSGTYDTQQRYVTDYNGTTKAATVSPAFGGTPSTDTFMIVERFTSDDELQQVEMDEITTDYTGTADCPEVYALMTDTSIMVGPVPDSSDVVFYGLYFYRPTAMALTTDSLPYNGIFDEVVRAYVSQIGMLRDEYNLSVEESIKARMEAEVVTIIKERVRRKPGSGQSPMRGRR